VETFSFLNPNIHQEVQAVIRVTASLMKKRQWARQPAD
jgi:hypothetical protein